MHFGSARNPNVCPGCEELCDDVNERAEGLQELAPEVSAPEVSFAHDTLSSASAP